uniref:Reverse transcriptase domain-containing protein n=1 Tax=Tanacetum cinerariifolium TaxID=118510 RepID=A0A6L2KUV5_TANCI|nr:reverse transcriptase domain-containing protein [Tanacetum cinerariifolium]
MYSSRLYAPQCMHNTRTVPRHCSSNGAWSWDNPPPQDEANASISYPTITRRTPALEVRGTYPGEQIEGHLSALKSLVKEHNCWGDVSPIHLSFDDEEGRTRVRTVVTGKEVVDVDLKRPFKEAVKTPLTRRIIEFAGPEFKMSSNIKLYDGTTDPEDRLSRFSSAAISGEWPMPVWCRMFQQTLDGSARGWFENLSRGSIDGWVKLRQQFTTKFLTKRACFKDPIDITKIVRKANETLVAFKERWIVETGLIAGVPEVMKISSFMDAHNRREDRFHMGGYGVDRRRNEGRNAFNNRDGLVAYRPQTSYQAPKADHQGYHNVRVNLNSLTKQPKEILASELQLNLQPPRPMQLPLKKENQDRYCDYHGEKGHYINDCFQLRRQLEMALESRKLNHLIKDAGMEGYLVRREYVDHEASVEVMFDHCFENLSPAWRSRLRSTQMDLVGFAGDVVKPLVKIELEVVLGDGGLFRRVMINFTVVWAPSPYYVILGRTGLRTLQAVSSTIHSMNRSKMIEAETSRGIPPERDPQERVDLTKQILVNPTYPDQLVTIRGNMFEGCKNKLKALVRKSMDVFTWEPADMTERSRQRRLMLATASSHSDLVPSASPKTWLVSSNSLMLSLLKRYNEIMFTQDPKSVIVSKGSEFPSLQALSSPHTYPTLHYRLERELGLQEPWRGEMSNGDLLLGENEQTKLERLHRSNVSFHQALDLIFELDAASIECTRVILSQRDFLDRLSEIPWVVPTFVFIEGEVLADFLSEALAGTPSRRILSSTGPNEKQGRRGEVDSLHGLRVAKKIKVQDIEVKVDSKLDTTQINKSYVVNSISMIKYLATARECITRFKSFAIQNIPKNLNQKADILSKLATHAFHHLTKEDLVKLLAERSTDQKEVSTVVKEEEDNWMTPIIRGLAEGIWPKDKDERKPLRMKINQYVLEGDVIFKKGYLVPMIRCVGPLQANYVIREIHMGSCGMHIRARSVVAKAISQGYYWPTMHKDARNVTKKFDSCQNIMDRNSSIKQFGLRSNEQSSLIDDIESMGDWDAPYQCNTAKGNEMIETKEFIYYRMKTEGKSERYIAPCFVNGHDLPNGEINLGNYKNLISSDLAARLCLKLKDKRGVKVLVRKLLVIIKGEVYHVKFIVNPNKGDSTTGIVLGKSFLKTSRGIFNDEARSSRSKRTRERETMEEALLPQRLLNEMGCGEEIEEMLEIKVIEMGGDEEMFTSKAWRRALIKFRLSGKDHSLTLVQFAKPLGLYENKDISSKGFESYFIRGLHSDDNFNARDYWLRISSDDDLQLSRSHVAKIKKPVLRVFQKMISYSLCQRTNGHDKMQKNDLWLLSLFEAKNQDRLNTLTYYKSLDKTTLRELIISDKRLIPEDGSYGDMTGGY